MTDRVRLVVLSFLMLFVELALIRWAGSNILYLSYFSNFVLLGSFLGIGLATELYAVRLELVLLVSHSGGSAFSSAHSRQGSRTALR